MVVVVTGPAEADLEHIAARNPVRALTFVRELRDKCEALADGQRACPLVPRHEHFGIRRRPHGDYLIFYRVGVDAVHIVHNLHGAQNYESILFPEE
jgi:toxin ParE1/3/4